MGRRSSPLHRRCSWLALMVLALGPLGSTAAASRPVAGTGLPLPEHTARYAVFRKGTEVGYMDIRLTRHEDGSYRFSAGTTATSTLLRILGLALGEQGRFRWTADGIRPLSYEQTVRRPGRDKHWEARFDWASLRVRGDSHRGPIDVALSAGVLDPLTVRLQLAVRLGADGSPAPAYRFQVLERDELEVQTFVRRGRDHVPYGDGCLPAVRMERLRDGAGRGDFSWHAEVFHWMPVRILQVRDGEPTMDLRLRRTSESLGSGSCPP